MKKATLWTAALLLLMGAIPVAAQNTTVQSFKLAVAWEMDGEGIDVDQVIAATALVDDGTSVADADWTILANPDTCRLLDLTIVDTNLNVGTITVTGTDCWGEALVATYAFTSSDDTGVVTLAVDNSTYAPSGAYFATVTLVTTGTMTGESDETFALGHSTGTPSQFAILGKRMNLTAAPYRYVDPGGFITPTAGLVKNGTGNALVSSDTDLDSFRDVLVGDLLLFQFKGEEKYALVTVKTDADNITINRYLRLATDGQAYRYKKRYVSSDPQDGWLHVYGWESAFFIFDVDSNTNTGGLVSSIQCTSGLADYDDAVEVDTDTVASAATGNNDTALDLSLTPAHRYCRIGVKFGTNDDDDTGAEDINLTFGRRK